MTDPLPYLDADAVASLPVVDAVAALEGALLGGLDPDEAGTRTVVDVAQGQLLLMPAESSSAVGIKLATVAPGNPAHGLPRIQGIYLLVDRGTLTPQALLDGTALTNLRTPAVSALAVRQLAAPQAQRLVVFGSGPQAWGHVLAVRAVRPLDSVTVVGRDLGRARRFAERVEGLGLSASVGTPADVGAADVVVCATTAAEPLFPGHLVADHACVVAVGSHEPDRRELDGALLRRAATTGSVVVETPATAMREAGDVILAVGEGALTPDHLVSLADVVRRDVPGGGPHVFKSVGMGWQDLVVAAAVRARCAGPAPGLKPR